MDQRTLVMTSGPEELPYQPNDLFESDFSNAVAQVNFDLNSEPCLGGLSSGYEVEKGSWGQPWPAGEDKLSSHLPTKAQCESLDLFCSDLSNPGCPLFSTISNELFAQEGDLSTSSLEFNSGVLVNSGMAQATQGHVKIDTDQSSFVGYNPDELDNLFRAEPFLDSKSKVSSSRLAELSNGEPFEELEVSPERPDCDEKATNVEENDAQSMMDVDPTEPTKKDQLFWGNDDDRITWTQVDKNDGPIDIPATNDADKLPTTNDAEDHDRLTNDDNERGTSNDMDELANEEYNEITNEGADAPDMMEQDPPPSYNPENDMSIPQSPLNPGAIENTSPLRKNSEAQSGLTSSPTEETITEPTEVGGPTPLSDEEPPVDAISLTHSQQTCMFHPVVIIELTEPVKPTSDFFRCATCKHSVENADLLIEHHFNCHSASSRKDTPEDVPNASPPPSLSPVKKEKFKGPYTCKKCHITFTKINPYVRHMREHTGKTPYVCEICGRYFAQAGGVRRHQEKTRICNPLNRVKKVKKIKVRASLGETSATEVAAVESAEKIPECQVKLWKISKVHECTYCHKTFLSRVKAKKHQYNLHKGATPSPIVTKVISNEKTPSQEPEYTFKCPICPRFFKYSFNRGRHLRKCVKQKNPWRQRESWR